MTQDPDRTLRLVWPQWQGAGTSSVEGEAGEFPLAVARRGYAVGSAVLDALLPPAHDSAARVPVAMGDDDLAVRDGIEAKTVVVRQLGQALEALDAEQPARVLTLGGECSVSVAPFAHLAARYDDLAVVWIDSHPDVDDNGTDYDGYHAMAVTALVGHGDPDVLAQLPATIDPSRVAVAGLHSWTDDAYPHLDQWGIRSFPPDALRTDSGSLLEWLRATGCRHVAIHLDVDTVDSGEVVLGLGKEPDGLRIAEVRRLVQDLAGAADVVALTIAEFIPRQVMHLLGLLDGMPLVGTVGFGIGADVGTQAAGTTPSEDHR